MPTFKQARKLFLTRTNLFHLARDTPMCGKLVPGALVKVRKKCYDHVETTLAVVSEDGIENICASRPAIVHIDGAPKKRTTKAAVFVESERTLRRMLSLSTIDDEPLTQDDYDAWKESHKIVGSIYPASAKSIQTRVRAISALK